MEILTLPELDMLAWYSLPAIEETLPYDSLDGQVEDEVDEEPTAGKGTE
jgi:hypothetical protein